MGNSKNKKRNHSNLLKIINNSFLKIVIIFLMTSMVSIISVNVFFRYVLNFSLTFSAELAGYLMVWIAFLGTVTVYYNDDHIAVDLVEKILKKPTLLKKLHLFQHIACIIFFIILTVYGFTFFNMTSNQACASMSFPPLNYIYIIIPISGILALIGAIYKVYYIITSKKG